MTRLASALIIALVAAALLAGLRWMVEREIRLGAEMGDFRG